ncbi:DUF2207 domain-containing protein, partial [Actinomadura logoneensis]|uniref:DUF2207 domain-containing protein n=1 Tax=Actinomadura logoneensis TaxID=2293572 RepID=UPI001313DADE
APSALPSAVLPTAAAAPAAVAVPSGATPGEHVGSYAVRLDLGADGLLRVHEEIAYDFGGSSGRHGIERSIPARRVRIEHVRVASTDAPAASRVSDRGSRTDIRVGDPARTVTGLRHYTIDYDVRHAVASDTLDWNAVGTEWTVPIDTATVTLTGPAAFRSLDCRAGPPDARTPCAGPGRTGGGTATFTQSLGAGQGITVRAAFPAGTVRNQRPGPFAVSVGVPGATALGLALLVALSGVGLRLSDRWRRRRLPASVPRDAVPPAEVGSLPNGIEPWDPLAVVALDLAVRGELRVADDGRRVTLTRVRADTGGLPDDERAFLKALFDDGDTAEAGPSARERLQRTERRILNASRERGRRHRRSWLVNTRWILVPACWLVGIAGFVLVLAGLRADGGFDDRSAAGTALVLLAVATGLLWPRNPVTRRGQALSVRYQRYLHSLWTRRGEPDAERHLPYAAATGQRSWMTAFFRARTADGSLPSWYSYTGGPDEAEERFVALVHMFVGKARPSRYEQRSRPASSRRKKRRTSGSGGYGGYGGGLGGVHGGGGFGGGHGGGGADGGGGGGSW